MASTRNPKIPRLIQETDLTRLPLGPTDGFVLSRIDGTATVEEIADMTSLEVSEVLETVQRLIDAEAAEWVEPSHPRTRHSSMPRLTPPKGAVRTKPPPPNTSRTLYDPQELEEPDVDLDVDRRREILDTYYRLEELSFYELLNVPEGADKKEIRAGYFQLSKKFHPDTLFGKRLGTYKAKMEAVFKQLTEAYETLGKSRQRAEYDAYLKLRKRTMAAQKSLDEGRRRAERLERESLRAADRIVIEPERTPEEPPDQSPPAAEAPAERPVTPPEAAGRAMSAEAKKRSKQLLAKKLAAAAGRRLPGDPGAAKRSSSAAPRPVTPPPPAEEPPRPRDREALLRGLTSSLRQVASLTGGIDKAQRHLQEARRAEREGNLVAAANSLRLALALAPEREDLEREHDRVSKQLAINLADTYEKQAQYEERNKRWGDAALSWARVCEGRPDDAHANVQAAATLLQAGGDLATAKGYAQRAVDLVPDDSRARRVLGRVFFAAGMTLNAKRELERAAELDPADEIVKNLLRELGKKK